MDFNNIPSELKFNALWCCWKMVDGKKLPFNPRTGDYAKSNDKSTFSSFKVALNNLYKYEKKNEKNEILGGLGLGIFEGYSAIDIDHCIDDNGVINAVAQDIIDYCQSYTEYSPSGKGIRIIFKTDTKINKQTHYIKNSNLGLEIYISDNTNKYVTITGNTCISSEINTLNIDYILNKYMKKEKKNDIIDTFLNKDSKFKELWNSNASGFGGNESETDCALISKLMFYFQNDKDLVEQYFIQSPYYKSKDEAHKDKWERQDYREGIYNLTYKQETYNPIKYSNKHFELTDTGNAHLFKDKYGEIVRYNYDNKSWMIWNDTNWQYDYCNQIKLFVEHLVEEIRLDATASMDKEKINHAKKTSNRSGKENLLAESQHLLPITNSMLDTQDYLFNCKNGILNLKTLEFMTHNKNLYMSNMSNVSYIKNAKPKKFIKFLNDIFEGNQDKINFIRKLFAYCFTGEIKDQAFIIFYGEGSNGKSVLIDIISEIMGDYSTTANKDLLIDKKFQTQAQSEVARLKGKRCIFISETESGDKLKEAFVKDITGGNEITARFLYGNEFTYKPKFTPILVTNHLPIINAMDSAILRRLYPVDFSRIFKEHEQNINLTDELREEKDEIFSWIVEDSWYKKRLHRPKFIIDNINSYKKEMDIVEKWIEDWCEVSDEYYETSSKLFRSFNQYCKENKLFEMNSTLFGRNMGKKYQKIRRNNGINYLGIKLKGSL